MKAPSSKKLQESLGISAEDAKLIRAFAEAADDPSDLKRLVGKVPRAEAYVRSLYGDPYGSYMWRVTVALHAIDQILGGFGVEVLGDDEDYRQEPPYEYINMGDTYATTLVYDREKDRLFIGSWGDMAERLSNPSPGVRSANPSKNPSGVSKSRLMR